MQGWIDVLVGLPSSDWILSGGLPLLLEEWKEGMVLMDTAWAIVEALSCANEALLHRSSY